MARTDSSNDPSNNVGRAPDPYYTHDERKGVPRSQLLSSAVGNSEE